MRMRIVSKTVTPSPSDPSMPGELTWTSVFRCLSYSSGTANVALDASTGIATLTMTKKPVNSLSTPFIKELRTIFDQAAVRPCVRMFLMLPYAVLTGKTRVYGS